MHAVAHSSLICLHCIDHRSVLVLGHAWTCTYVGTSLHLMRVHISHILFFLSLGQLLWLLHSQKQTAISHQTPESVLVGSMDKARCFLELVFMFLPFVFWSCSLSKIIWDWLDSLQFFFFLRYFLMIVIKLEFNRPVLIFQNFQQELKCIFTWDLLPINRLRVWCTKR